MSHVSVLLHEAVDQLINNPSGFYIDGTYGRGGHSRVILNRLNANGKLLVMDKDADAILHAQQLAQTDERVVVAHDSFAQLGAWVTRIGWQENVSGVLLDLGVSSPQLDQAQRGFSFLHDGPLDMRMNQSVGMSAAQWLAIASEQEIADVIYTFGEERYSRRIARAIVTARQTQTIERTQQFADIVAKAHPKWEKGKNPATRTFQAIRIFINNELNDVQSGLRDSVNALAVGGRLVVISFHSLEDRIVKRFIQNEIRGPQLPRDLPIMVKQMPAHLKKIGKSMRASNEEVAVNPRSRSAIMRVAEKCA